MKRLRRTLSVVLSMAMILQMGFTPAMAQTITADNPCEHHTEHTDDCGFAVAKPCTHTHDATCGFEEAVAGSVCNHQHADCGYAEETPCTFTREQCEICTPKDSGSMPAIGMNSTTVTGFDPLDRAVTQRVVSVGTTFDELNLPATLGAMGYIVTADTEVVDSSTTSDDTTPATIRIEGVTWELGTTKNVNATYNPVLGTYCFTAILPAGYTLAEGVVLPELWVRVGDKARAEMMGDFTVTDGEKGTDYSYAGGVLTILTKVPLTISNTSETATADRIVVNSGVTANLTLSDVNIETAGLRLHPLAIPMDATVNLTLDGTNTLKGTGQFSAGIHVPTGATLTIDGSGSLTATGGGEIRDGSFFDGGAGIGGGVIADDVSAIDGGNGKITINSGTVTAQGGINAAGIGSSSKGNVGEIIINGGIVTATGNGGAGIGGSTDGSGGKITITDGEVIATSSRNGAGIGGDDSEITITGGKVTATGASSAAGIGGNANKSGGKIAISGGEVTAKGGTYGAGIGGGINQSGGEIAISGTATVTSTGGGTASGIGGGGDYVGVGGGEGGTIIISGTATVTANGGEKGAGIGGGVAANGGKITISDGIVKATGGKNSAGIGGGGQGDLPSDVGVIVISGDGGEITISGGKVEATGGLYGAGIGGGQGGNGGTIAIKEAAEVTAIGGDSGAGIGGGSGSGSGSTVGGSDGKGGGNGGEITISGGAVNAKGGRNGAGIGGGDSGNGGTIAITGGKVDAFGGGIKASGGGSGIGGGGASNGNGGGGGTVNISGGVVSATGWKDAVDVGGAGIGGGAGSNYEKFGGAGAVVTISGGTVTATGGNRYNAGTGRQIYTCAIGAGEKGTDTGKLTITGGSVQLVQGTIATSTPAENGETLLKPVTLTINDVTSTLLTWMNFPAYRYGAKDVQTDGDGKVYVWLPTTETPALVYATAGSSFYGNIISTDTEVTLSEFDATVTTLDELKTALADDTKKQILVDGSFTIDDSTTIEITDGINLTIKPGVTITNNGIIALMDGKVNYGEPAYGIIAGNKVAIPSEATLTVLNSSGTMITSATYGDTVTLTVTATSKTAVTGVRTAIRDKAIFYLGSNANGTRLGETTVAHANGKTTATLDITLQDTTDIDWKIAANSLFVEFGGSSVGGLLNSTASGSLTVTAKPLTINDMTTPLRVYDGTKNINLIGGKLFGIVSGDDVTATIPTKGTVESADVGTTKPVNIVSPTLEGIDADNYSLSPLTLSVNITAATPTLTWSAESETLPYTGSPAALTKTLTVVGANGEIPDGTITYTYTEKAKVSNVFGLFAETATTPPTNVGSYIVKATIAAKGNYTDASTTTDLTLNIIKSTPTLDIKNYTGKNYDGNPMDKPTVDQMSITGVVYANVDFAYSVNEDMSSATATPPTNAGTYWVQASVTETDNTEAATSKVVSFTIAQARLTITGGIVTPKQWDSNASATVTELIFNGLQNGETLTFTTDYLVGAPAYNDASVGMNKTVSGTASLVSNIKTENYELSGDYSITGQAITLADGPLAPSNGVVNDAKGTDTYTFSSTNDTVYEYSTNGGSKWTDINASGTTTAINVGNIAVAVGGLQVRVKATATHRAGAILRNEIVFTASIEGSVSINGTATYGETLTASATGTQEGAVLSYKWLVGTEELQTGTTLVIPGTAVGKTITVEVTATGYNEMLTSTTTAMVAKKEVPATASIISKEYDGSVTVESTDQTLSIDKVTGDDITVIAPKAIYNNKTVDTGKDITLGELQITGVAADWYDVIAPSNVTGSITTKPVTVTAEVKEKDYDGNTNATVDYGVSKIIDGDSVTVSGTATFADANAGSNKTVNITNISLGGKDGSNYKLSSTTAFVQGTIKPADVTAMIEPITAVDYDGTQIKPNIVVKTVTGTKLASTDYTVGYGTNINAGKDATVTVTAKTTGNYTFANVMANFTINKAEGSLISDNITGSYTGDGTNFTYTIMPISGAEYKMDSGAWQVSEVFKGIAPLSEHTFSARMKETDNHKAGTEKDGDKVKFVKLSGVAAPTLAYTLSRDGGKKTITITAVDKAEYQFGSDSWGDAKAKTYTTEETVTIGIRMKETSTHVAGTAATENVSLAKPDQSAPATFVLTFVANDETDYTVTIPTEQGCEYSFDGITYSGTNTKTANVGDRVTGYLRKAETNTHNASPAVSASVTLPKFKVKSVTTPNGGIFTNSVSVTLSSGTVGAEIYYTTDGSVPSTGSTKYATAFTLTSNTTVKAIAVKAGMTDSDVTSYAFTKNSGSTGSGGGYTPTKPSDTNLTAPTTVEISVSSSTDKNSKATATVKDKIITDAIAKARREAKKNGTEKNGAAIVIDVKINKTATTLESKLSKESIHALVQAGVLKLTIRNDLSTVELDLAAIQSLPGGDVALTVSKTDATQLSAEAKTAIGNRPVFRYSVTVDGKVITDFKSGKVGLQMPYIRTTTEQVGNLYGVYVDSNGKITWMKNSSYDPITGTMLIFTNHFSVYGIGYKQSTPKFTDVANHWAKTDIEFVVARGLLTGTSSTTFSPNTAMTRGMFVTALGRLAGADVSSYKTSSFSDVKADAYYIGYIEWANKNGILKGIGDGKFAPDISITREQMAVILVNYSKTIGYKLPSVHTENSFVDASNISAKTKDAVKQMQMAGILMGKSGNRFDPTAIATRAEVSAMLRRFVELVVSTRTAEGWMMNDSGKWMYYEKGKGITRKKKIAGETYTFDRYGETTEEPKNLTYGSYIVKKGDSFRKIAFEQKCNMFELAKVNGKTISSIINAGDELKIPQK